LVPQTPREKQLAIAEILCSAANAHDKFPGGKEGHDVIIDLNKT